METQSQLQASQIHNWLFLPTKSVYRALTDGPKLIWLLSSQFAPGLEMGEGVVELRRGLPMRILNSVASRSRTSGSYAIPKVATLDPNQKMRSESESTNHYS